MCNTVQLGKFGETDPGFGGIVVRKLEIREFVKVMTALERFGGDGVRVDPYVGAGVLTGPETLPEGKGGDQGGLL